MEWDQIAEKWTQMALRLRNVGPTGARGLGASTLNDLSAQAPTQTPSARDPSNGLTPMISAERAGNDLGLTPDR